jgi:hypothetical protein
MKNAFAIFGIFLLVWMAWSCKETKSETSDAKTDTVQVQKNVTADLKIKIFFRTYDGVDDEGNEYKSNTIERENFQAEKAYIFCYDSEEFDHMTIEGNAEHVSIEIKTPEATVYSKSDFKIDKAVTFTKKDFSFNVGVSYKVIIKQNNQPYFEGAIDSQGCM